MYANKMNMSKAAVYEQLISESMVKNLQKKKLNMPLKMLKANWKENALYKADMYAK